MAATIYSYSLDRLPPGRMIIDVLGGGAESPRSVTGDSGAVDFCAGLWSVKYAEMFVHRPYQHLYWSWLGGMLNTRVRTIRVPILSDWFAPVPGNDGGALYITDIPHSDGSFFSDDSGYSQSTINAELAADAAMGDGTIQIRVLAGGDILGGEIFSISHPTQDWRAYKTVDIDDVTTDGDGFSVYTVSLNMAIKEDALAGTVLRFDRPLCIMRLAPGTTIPLDVAGFQLARPDIQFLEAGDLS